MLLGYYRNRITCLKFSISSLTRKQRLFGVAFKYKNSAARLRNNGLSEFFNWTKIRFIRPSAVLSQSIVSLTPMANILHIPESRVKKLLTWESTFETIELALKSVVEARAVQNPRSITKIPKSNNSLFSMPGYLDSEDLKALGCKLVTAFPNNDKEHNLPSVMANILLFDEQTGTLQAIIAGTEITAWRTAAASAVATKHLHLRHSDRKTNTLAILGAGTQGTTHAIAFQNIFHFGKVHIWNRNNEKGADVVKKLNSDSNCSGEFIYFDNVEECVKNADVIVTATYSTVPFLKMGYLKKGVHINAVGAGSNVLELEESIYKNAYVYVDHFSGARDELSHLIDAGIQFKAEIGTLVNNTTSKPDKDTITVFQSLGMAAEDCAMARMIYNKHMANLVKSTI